MSTDDGDVRLPKELVPAALVILAERIRPDAAETLAFFTAQGVGLKVISGDNPRTVGAVAATLGLPGVRGAGRGRRTDVANRLNELAGVLERHSAFGRVTPQQKRAIVGCTAVTWATSWQ